MIPRTHLAIDRRLCGAPLRAGEAGEEGVARVGLTTTSDMAVDDRGLVHGGFVFGLADHAAMLAVNDPFVVLGSAEVRFLRPVVVGERLVAEARVGEVAGRKSRVAVEVRRATVPAVAGADAESAGDAAAGGSTVAVGEGDGGAAAAGEDGGGGEVVMRGEFVCLTLDRHVLQAVGG